MGGRPGQEAPAPTRHRVVVVGGGFGGLRVVRDLARAPVDVTLIDRNNHHLFQPLLYQVATGLLSGGQIAPAFRRLLRHQRNATVVLADATAIDLGRRLVRTEGSTSLAVPYDTLVVAAGAGHSYFGHDEWSRVAPGLKSLDDANRLRTLILGAFELAEQEPDAERRQAWMTFVVVGAGPTGVEIAGQIAVLSRRVLRDEYRTIDSADARIVLIDAAPHVLGALHPDLQARAARDLEKLGVEVQLGRAAVEIDDHGIEIAHGDERRHIAAHVIVWAAGVQASALGRQLAEQAGIATDRAGRIVVAPDCTLPGHPDVFVIGDMASVPGVPGVAQGAIQEGRYAARVIAGRLAGRAAPKPFAYKDKGSMATIGRTHAVVEIGRLRFGGLPAFLVWGIVHLAYLVGWGNRFEAVVRWMWNLLARQRRERLISVVSLVDEDVAEDRLRALRR